MTLISAEQITKIKEEIYKVTETFFTTPVEYRKVGEALREYGEAPANNEEEVISLLGMVEFVPQGDDTKGDAGGLEEREVKVSFNYKDLQTAGMIGEDTEPKVNTAVDYLIINAKKYTILKMYMEGAFDTENILVILKGKLQENRT